MVRTFDPEQYPCLCVTRHVPALKRTHEHHIVPLSWGGPDTPDNTVALCPTGHDVVHWHLWQWERASAQQPTGTANRYLYDVAARGWAGRPEAA